MFRYKILVSVALLVGLTSNPIAQQANDCQAVSIRCPVATGCPEPTDGGMFQRNRLSPVDGAIRNHNGVDYPGTRGTGLLAAASGMVERSYFSQTYGETIVIRHEDGAATLYAHLQTRDVQVGNTVVAGQQIGTMNSTGRSTGDHLHFEYVPNGRIIQSPNRIDPHACVGTSVNGNITISDNGRAADDSFRAAVDGFVIGETTIGASNNLAANNLVPGEHTLTVTALVAPDNIATLQIDLSNGWVFSSGSTTVSDNLEQGESKDYLFNVPQ